MPAIFYNDSAKCYCGHNHVDHRDYFDEVGQCWVEFCWCYQFTYQSPKRPDCWCGKPDSHKVKHQHNMSFLSKGRAYITEDEKDRVESTWQRIIATIKGKSK